MLQAVERRLDAVGAGERVVADAVAPVGDGRDSASVELLVSEGLLCSSVLDDVDKLGLCKSRKGCSTDTIILRTTFNTVWHTVVKS